ncbi:MAG: ParA family protein [Geminicoccaceae bacterium]
MNVIAFVTQKGGSGKTTLCVNLAVAAEAAGGRCLILDMDPQGTAESWYHDRDAASPKLVKLGADSLAEAVGAARRQGFTHVFIDTPGRDEPSVAAAIRIADFCLVPCRPTPADMKATPATIATIRRLAKPAAFVLSQTPPRGFRIKEAEIGLAVLGPVAPVTVVSRSVFQDAQGAGLGVGEFEPDGKAAQEIDELWGWLVKKMEKMQDGTQKNIA